MLCLLSFSIPYPLLGVCVCVCVCLIYFTYRIWARGHAHTSLYPYKETISTASICFLGQCPYYNSIRVLPTVGSNSGRVPTVYHREYHGGKNSKIPTIQQPVTKVPSRGNSRRTVVL
jgi:hypothetical protein